MHLRLRLPPHLVAKMRLRYQVLQCRLDLHPHLHLHSCLDRQDRRVQYLHLLRCLLELLSP